MDAGCVVYVNMGGVYIIVFSFPTYDSAKTSFCYFVFVHNVDLSGLYVGMRDNWSGRNVGQLAVQHIHHRHSGYNCVYMGLVVCAYKKVLSCS